MAVASLVLGIISIVCGLFLTSLQWLGAIIGIIGIVLGVKARKVPEQHGMATAGLVCSIIGLILCILMYVACAACVGALGSL